MGKNKDQRRHERIETRIVAEFKVQASDKKGWTVLDDLGVGGISFQCDQDLKVDSNVNLKIGIAVSQDITCAGKVVRVVGEPDSEFKGVAIEFTDISEEAREVLKDLIERKCKKI